MIIRKIQPEDSEAVFAMMRAFYNTDAVIHTSSDRVLHKDIEDCLSDMPFVEGYVMQEQEGGELIGYGMVSRNYTTEYGGICIWIEDLYFKEAYRNQGRGSIFFQYIEKAYPEAVRFKLEVEQENERAVHTYLKNGYAVSEYFLMTREIDKDDV